MNLKEQYVKSHQEHVEKIQEWIDDCDWIPDIPDEWSIYHVLGFSSSRECCVHLPFNRNMYSVVKEYFASIGWHLVQDHTDESKLSDYQPWTSLVFSPDTSRWGKTVMIRFDPYAEGSVCKRKQIGVTNKEVPVYEFACE